MTTVYFDSNIFNQPQAVPTSVFYFEPLKTVQSSANEKEEKMTEKTDAQITRDYLLRRADDASYKLRSAIPKQFGVDKASTPSTYKQLIEAIKNDKFTLDEKQTKVIDFEFEDAAENGWSFHGSPFQGIKFTEFPGYDGKGAEAARKELADKYTALKDSIMVFPAEQALKALKAFEEWKPSNLPKN